MKWTLVFIFGFMSSALAEGAPENAIQHSSDMDTILAQARKLPAKKKGVRRVKKQLTDPTVYQNLELQNEGAVEVAPEIQSAQ